MERYGSLENFTPIESGVFLDPVAYEFENFLRQNPQFLDLLIGQKRRKKLKPLISPLEFFLNLPEMMDPQEDF